MCARGAIRFPAFYLTLAAHLILASPGDGQISAFEHTCMDCHLTDHSLSVGGGAPSETGLAITAITRLVPGLSVKSATCLQCHGSLEQRRRRIVQEGNGLGVPLEGGLYVGFSESGSHPLGDEPRPATAARRSGRSAPFSIDRPENEFGDLLRGPRESVECAACHAVHSYDVGVGTTKNERSVCLSCHDPGMYAFRAHSTPTCGDCHQQHNASGPNLTREMDADALCAACHEGSGRMPMNRVDPSLHGPPTHADLRVGACSDCHKIHGDPGGG